MSQQARAPWLNDRPPARRRHTSRRHATSTDTYPHHHRHHRHHHRHNHALAACMQHVLDALPVAASGLLRHMLVLMGAAGPQCATGGRSAVTPHAWLVGLEDDQTCALARKPMSRHLLTARHLPSIRLRVDGEQHSAHHFTPARRHLQRECRPSSQSIPSPEQDTL